MSVRHLPRQQDRDARMHDPSPSAPPHPHPPHHLNGASAIPSTPNAISPAIGPSTVPNGQPQNTSIIHKLNVANEQTWLLIGRVAEQMGDLEHALSAYESALRHNPMSLSGLTQVAGIARIKENYPKAIDYFQRVVSLQDDNGEVWSALGHCYLMQDDLQKAYSAYQQALYLLPNPKEDPKLWYGIGILYDRYGSLDHAEEAFSSVLRMDKDFDKANEILFRLGIIYKQQGKYADSLDCFDRILRNPPSPLAHADIWFQIGHVYEQQKDYHRAKDAYERVVADNPAHAKVLQQLGWLYHQDGSSFQNQDLAIQYLTKSLEADPSDAQSWYLLGRAYMAGQKYNKAYEAYQQAVYRDGRNPTFWCSIGVLYFQINQYRDALDAYSRAIRINPYISEVWFDLGSLYESCNNQITDAIDAYARASELDPQNPAITQRLQLLRQAQATGGQLPAAPGPQDVHPTAYASAVVPPPGLNGPLVLQAHHRPMFRSDSRGPPGEISLPPPSQVGNGRASSPPFRGGPPPPVILDDSRHISSHPPLAPMEVDRPPPGHPRDYPPPIRDAPNRGPAGHQNILLSNHGPSQQGPPEDLRNGSHPHPHDPYFNRSRPAHSRSISPAPHSARPRSPAQHGFGNYPLPRQPVGPSQPTSAPVRSPRTYAAEPGRPADREAPGWDQDRRGPPPSDQRDWERERDRRSRHSGEFPPPQFFGQHSPVTGHRVQSPTEPSPRQGGRYWESKPTPAPPSTHIPHRASPPAPPEHANRRYDPRYDVRERDYEAERAEPRTYPPSPENSRNVMRQPLPHLSGPRRSESPHPSRSVDAKDRRRRVTRDNKEPEIQPQPQPQQPQPLPISSASSTPVMQDANARKERRRRNGGKRKDDGGSETPKPEQQQQRGNFKVMPLYGDPSIGNSATPAPSTGESSRGLKPMHPPYSSKGAESPDPNMPGERDRFKLHQHPYGLQKGPGSPDGMGSGSDQVSREQGRQGYKAIQPPYSFKGPAGSPEPPSNGSGSSSRSVQPSPTMATPRPPVRAIDEDYDNDGVDGLIGLSQSYRGPPDSATPGSEHLAQSPTVSPGSRRDASPHPPSHRNSVSSTRSHASPSTQASQLKRARSPGSDESDNKRSRTDSIRRRSSTSGGRRTPIPSTRPSPIPFRTQLASHSPEARQTHEAYPPASPPPLSTTVVFPPHPRPVGAGHASSHVSSNSGPLSLPPIATLSPPASPSVHGDRDRDDRMQVDASQSLSPPMRKGGPVEATSGRHSSRTPSAGKQTPTPPMEKKEPM